jgi:carboxypeptidase Taq
MERLRVGDTSPLREWLKTNVHSKGSLVTAEELFIQATGEPLNPSIYLDHLSRRYLDRPFLA